MSRYDEVASKTSAQKKGNPTTATKIKYKPLKEVKSNDIINENPVSFNGKNNMPKKFTLLHQLKPYIETVHLNQWKVTLRRN